MFARFVTLVAAQAAAASITTPDPVRRVPPGTLPAVPVRARRVGRGRAVRRRDAGSRWPVVVVLLLIGAILTGLGLQRATGVALLPATLTPATRPLSASFPALGPSPPVALSIASVGLRAPVSEVGLAPDGTIATPPPERDHEAGWYDQSPTPGQYGPAVIVGHVDTRTGPAVFHDLAKVRRGDRVEVDREDGSVAVFQVTSVSRYDKEHLPVDRVYGDFGRPNLRLITCGGRWVGGRTGYADNIVVFASLVSARHR
jgi:hypothetical protein